jgi:hypothetical protein
MEVDLESRVPAGKTNLEKLEGYSGYVNDRTTFQRFVDDALGNVSDFGVVDFDKYMRKRVENYQAKKDVEVVPFNTIIKNTKRKITGKLVDAAGFIHILPTATRRETEQAGNSIDNMDVFSSFIIGSTMGGCFYIAGGGATVLAVGVQNVSNPLYFLSAGLVPVITNVVSGVYEWYRRERNPMMKASN